MNVTPEEIAALIGNQVIEIYVLRKQLAEANRQLAVLQQKQKEEAA